MGNRAGRSDAVLTETTPALEIFAPPSLRRSLHGDGGVALDARDESFEAAVLFADVSGFTALAARMTERGHAGTEELTRHLNGCFGTMLRLVREAGGEVEKFAGDALVATFRPDSHPRGLAEAIRSAARCATQIAQCLDGRTAADLALGVHVGVGVGTVRTRHLALTGETRAFLLTGEPFAQAARAVAMARRGEAFSSPEAAAVVPGLTLPAAGAGAPRRIRAGGDPARTPRREAPPHPATPRETVAHRALKPYLHRVLVERSRVALEASWMAELRRATVLFVSIGPGAPDGDSGDRVERVARVLGAQVERFDGLLHDFLVDDKGLVAIVLFGVTGAHEDDAARGLRAALALHAELDAVGVGVSVGVATGRVYCGVVGDAWRSEFAVVGDAMNLAARLMGVADGAVLCAPTTASEADLRFAFEAVAGLKLKGVAPDFVAHRVQRAQDPQRAPSLRAGSLVGRAREWEALERALHEYGRSRAFTAVVLEGEAGIGKSAIASALAAAAERLPGDGAGAARCLHVSADAIDQVSPYHAWRTATEEMLGVDPAATVEARRAGIEAEVASLDGVGALSPLLGMMIPNAPEETELTRALDSQGRSVQAVELMLALLSRLAARGPVVLVVEDAHWLDSASWSLLHRLALREAPVMLVVSTRPAAGAWKAALDAFAQLRGVRSLPIGPLDRESSAALIRSTLGVASLSGGVESFIFERTEGHPYFTEELALALREAGLLRVEGSVCLLAPSDRDAASLSTPDTLERVLISRIDRLPEGVRMVLKVASVIGRDLSQSLLTAVLPGGVEPEAVAAHLDTLCSFGLLTRSGAGAFRFNHAITQDVGYALLPFSQRRELHRAVAAQLASGPVDDPQRHAAQLAHHWGRGEVFDKALAAAEEAGTRAMQRFANREAVHFFREALRFDAALQGATSPQRVVRWESHLGLAHRALGELDESRRHIESALTRLSYPPPARSLRARATLAVRAAEMFLSPPLEVRGRARDETANAVVNAYNQLAFLSHYANDIEGMLFCNALAVRLARRAGASVEVGALYGGVAHMAAFSKLYGASQKYVAAAHAVAAEVGTPLCVGTVHQFTGHLAGCLGDLATFDRDMHRALHAYAALGRGRPWEEAVTNLGYLYVFQGELARSAEHGELLERSGRARDDAQTALWGIIAQGRARLAQGRLAEALERLNTAEVGISDVISQPDLFGNRALVHLRLGDEERAVADAERTVDLAERMPSTSYTTLLGYSGAMEALVLARHPRAGALGARMQRVFARYAETFLIARPQSAVWAGAVAWRRGRTGEAREHWERALKLARASSLREDEPMALRWLARAVPPEERRWLLDQAAGRFEASGRRYEAVEARRCLAGERGAKVPAPWEVD